MTIPGLSDEHVGQLDNVLELLKKLLIGIIAPVVCLLLLWRAPRLIGEVQSVGDFLRAAGLVAGPVLVLKLCIGYEPGKVIRDRVVDPVVDRPETREGNRRRSADDPRRVA